jgi:NLR family CARD domain-containing protein 3
MRKRYRWFKGEPFNLNLLEELIQHPKGGGHATEYRYYASGLQQQFGAQSPTSSYWVLMTREVLEGSKMETYENQKALVARYAKRTDLPYELPGALEAATAILSHYARSGERLYTDDPWTYTRCRELIANNKWPAIVGGFSSEGLVVGVSYVPNSSCGGVVDLRKL